MTEEIFANALENTCVGSPGKDTGANSTCFSTTQEESSFASGMRPETNAFMVGNGQNTLKYAAPFKPTGMSAIPPATNAFVPFMTDIKNAPVFKPTANYGFYP